MTFEVQVLFFLSLFGACNGILLSIYIALNVNKNKFLNYFLAALILTLSIRIMKSAFFYFNPKLSGLFIQVGLSACILIGPLLFLYLKSFHDNTKKNWLAHILPYLIGITLLGLIYPYVKHVSVWKKWIVNGIYLQWMIYVLISYRYLRSSNLEFSRNKENQQSANIWLKSIYFGVAAVLLAYIIGSYSSYIVGAISFTFILHLLILLLVFKLKKNPTFFDSKEKYKNKKIDNHTLNLIESGIAVVKDKELFTNPDLTLTDLAKEINVSSHVLSQYLNNNLGKSFSTYINEFRIEKAKELIMSNSNYTIEALGYESGFNSKSTFFTTFKKMTGLSPSEYKKSIF